MKKALVTVHLGRHFRIFGQYDYQVLKEMGYEVHIASNFSDYNDEFNDIDSVKHQVDFDRNPWSKKNIRAYFELKRIINENSFDLIQTQSPTAGVITRLAARKARRKGTKVFYTPHGYHFFKGAGLLRWCVYYPIEKFMGFFTDTTITINEEDFKLAKKRKIGKKVKKIPGVGVDSQKFSCISESEKKELRSELKFPLDSIVCSYVGELSERKNQAFLIKCFKEIHEEYPDIKLYLVGTGSLETDLKNQVNTNNLNDTVVFLGYRLDVDKIMKASDLILSSSYQEGLPVNIIEAMFSGKPTVVSACRGNRDLIEDGYNGMLFEVDNKDMFIEKIKLLLKDQNLRTRMATNTRLSASKYSIEAVQNKMKVIYQSD